MDQLTLWRRYRDYRCDLPALGFSLDISRMRFDEDFFAAMEPAMQRAFAAMAELENGAIANPDENRMVGHYWLRHSSLAPDDQIRQAIDAAQHDIRVFADRVHRGDIAPPQSRKFTDLLLIGIGGSALGPQLIADALGAPGGRKDKLALHFLDNTDPEGIDCTLAQLGGRLKSTLVLIVSKSGTTPETRNGMIEAIAYFGRKGVDFAKQAVAITMAGSKLDQQAQSERWLATFPMWDWVGGRTSLMSAVGLLPMALQGVDTHALLEGAAEMDRATRLADTRKNPAALLALMWHLATGGKGRKDMVILPYKDRLLLFSRYLQQLVMESLGKEKDLAGNVVNQGIAVYGNKGSTDQHAYVQQLREGVDNFFATFIVVLQDRIPAVARTAPEVDTGVTSGDFLSGFWQGTRSALYENGRDSMTVTIDTLEARTLGGLIALYERAVGLYAALVNVNAYHQPGVEAGKKAAAAVIDVQRQVVAFLKEHKEPVSAEQIADRLGQPNLAETMYHVLTHLAANKRGITLSRGKFKWKG
ncbi:MAG: glucose-6-phosphate isomerase [Phycisphaeraceae bacterium]